MSTEGTSRRGVRLILALLLATTMAAWAYPVRPDGPGALELAREQLPDGFVEVRSGAFVILSDADLRWTRERAALLERTRHQFQRVMSRMDIPLVEPREALVCVLFRDHGSYRAFARTRDSVEADWVSGYYATDTNRVVFFNDETAPDTRDARRLLERYESQAQATRREAAGARRKGRGDEAQRLEASADRLEHQLDEERARIDQHAATSATKKTIHEAVHLLSYNMGLQSPAHDYPFWISEGLASSFETSQPDLPFGPDRPNEAREAAFAARVRDQTLIPLREFIALRHAETEDALEADALYAQAYALFTYLFRSQRAELAAYLSALKEAPEGTRPPEVQVELFERFFGDVDEVEWKLLRAHDRR